MKKLYQSLDVNLTHNMIQVICHNLAKKLSRLSFILLFIFSIALNAQEGDHKNGRKLFNLKCASCHKLDKPLTGPPLRNVELRLEEVGKDRAWINSWIRNSSAIIKSGDPYAVKLYAEWNNTAMTAFTTAELSDQQISDILAYTAYKEIDPCIENPNLPECNPTGDDDDGGSSSNNLILGALALLFALLAIALYLVNQTLKRFADAKGVEVPVKDKSTPIWKAFVQNQFLVIVAAIFFLLASAYFVYGYLSQIGTDQNYEPMQPIHYSHRIHAGDNGIDCKYCHSSARVSKTSGIPSLNVCMNCHKTISEVSEDTYKQGVEEFGKDYNAEIQKLYKAVGWDEAEQAYTGETKPVQWIRIHNLPDFAYFNHSQHVTVAGVECQTCHGPVEEMEVMYQHAPLTMGWCINCHRETNVNVKDNAYYTKIHEELSKKYGVDQLTAAQMGGLECGKCHY